MNSEREFTIISKRFLTPFLFKAESGKAHSDRQIEAAVDMHGYSQKEVADHVGMQYSTMHPRRLPKYNCFALSVAGLSRIPNLPIEDCGGADASTRTHSDERA